MAAAVGDKAVSSWGVMGAVPANPVQKHSIRIAKSLKWPCLAMINHFQLDSMYGIDMCMMVLLSLWSQDQKCAPIGNS